MGKCMIRWPCYTAHVCCTLKVFEILYWFVGRSPFEFLGARQWQCSRVAMSTCPSTLWGRLHHTCPSTLWASQHLTGPCALGRGPVHTCPSTLCGRLHHTRPSTLRWWTGHTCPSVFWGTDYIIHVQAPSEGRHHTRPSALERWPGHTCPCTLWGRLHSTSGTF